jgi:DNA-binding beta-propeller fold protein YncE
VTNGGDDTVGRIDPNGDSVRFIAVGDEPAAVAVGAGAVWVANAGDGTVARIHPVTYDVETIDIGGEPAGIVVARGRVWVTVRQP